MARLLAFRAAREWEQFHSPRNLAVAISVEAGELLEHFQWLRSDERAREHTSHDALAMEVADIAILLSYFCHDLGIDVEAAIEGKLALNEQRYPVQKSRGNATKYDKL